MLLVSDLRQYTYCPRIIYYRTCLPTVRPTTFTMEAGKDAHQDEADRERRRSLRTYGLTSGGRAFDVWLEDAELGLRGKVDMVITLDSEVIPVEYKHSPGRLGHHIILQLAGYALLLERRMALPALRGFIYYIPARRSREIILDEELKAEVRQLLVSIEAMAAAERVPDPPHHRTRCEICEFRRFCNDVV